ncbi:UNVERIFIED_CONTAM: UDP-glycosyltransferase 86A1 [Sesamum indicum]
MLCFPLYTDQFTNRKLVVDDWKIGINLCDKVRVTSVEVAEKINQLKEGTIGDEVRVSIKNVKSTSEKALASEGSSEMNIGRFIRKIEGRIRENRKNEYKNATTNGHKNQYILPLGVGLRGCMVDILKSLVTRWDSYVINRRPSTNILLQKALNEVAEVNSFRLKK